MSETKRKKTTRKKKSDPNEQPIRDEPEVEIGPSESPAEPNGDSIWDTCQLDTDAIDPDEVDVNSTGIELPPATRQITVQSKAGDKATARSVARGKEQPRLRSTRRRVGMKTKTEADFDHFLIPTELGILPLRNVVVFPGTVIPLAVGRPRSRRLLAALAEGQLNQEIDEITANDKAALNQPDNVIGVITQKDPSIDNPTADDLYPTGTAVTVLKTLKLPDGQNSLVVHGLVRFKVVEWLSIEPFMQARIEVITSEVKPSKTLQALAANIRHTAEKMIQLAPNIPDEVNVVLSNIEDPGALADFLAANINIPIDKKQELLETIDVEERLQKLSVALAGQLELLELSDKIHQQVSQSIDKTQREYFLQEQLKAIQTELGQTDQKSQDIAELKQDIIDAQMPEKVEDEAMRELERLSRIHSISPEFSVLRSYIEWLCELPWSKSSRDKLDLVKARRILNRDHYDLVQVKKRILEFLAVRKLNPQGRSPILCLVGPPGVGKTSLGRSIAASMGREFVRVSLGGMRDEAEIRGHRRTYIGAIPGRIIQELRKCGTNNPVFMLDELDKIGADFRGDPASALLEVLDPEQNNTFTDHYIDQPFDLSKTIFIATANYMGPVPPALRDRMEVLELPGYTTDDKLAIAKRYLVPRQLKENGLTASKLKLGDETLLALIESYTREAGVRELERKIASVCRAVAADIAEGKRKSATVTPTMLGKLIGPILYESELAMRSSVPGVATGLAYTPVGGEILFIEATIMPGSGQLLLTGQLGDVMKESAQAAFSVLKNLAVTDGSVRRVKLPKDLLETIADEEALKKRDIHIHVPAGAIPKDGPSAGLAMFTSLASLLSGRSVRHDIAMTGEITLTGSVLPIGGVKEKVIAAKRAGIKTVILPERNRKNLEDLPKNVLKGIKFQFVKRVEKVLKLALEAK
ncbi:MAG: endopeptidase La [Sedimentisphaerales bacterium]|nr:endopeptidase La [Sedimentisphaerales bacterium]